MGGKSPNVVDADCDIEAATAGAAVAIFFNHGQCCAAGSRLLVERKVFDRVVEGVAEAANNVKCCPARTRSPRWARSSRRSSSTG